LEIINYMIACRPKFQAQANDGEEVTVYYTSTWGKPQRNFDTMWAAIFEALDSRN